MVWQKAMDFAAKVYQLTKRFPTEERFGLVSQLNRSSLSIPSNIAEGAGRDSKKEFSQFISVAMGSCFEAETQLLLSVKFGLVSEIEISELIKGSDEIQKMLTGLKKSLNSI